MIRKMSKKCKKISLAIGWKNSYAFEYEETMKLLHTIFNKGDIDIKQSKG